MRAKKPVPAFSHPALAETRLFQGGRVLDRLAGQFLLKQFDRGIQLRVAAEIGCMGRVLDLDIGSNAFTLDQPAVRLPIKGPSFNALMPAANVSPSE